MIPRQHSRPKAHIPSPMPLIGPKEVTIMTLLELMGWLDRLALNLELILLEAPL